MNRKQKRHQQRDRERMANVRLREALEKGDVVAVHLALHQGASAHVPSDTPSLLGLALESPSLSGPRIVSALIKAGATVRSVRKTWNDETPLQAILNNGWVPAETVRRVLLQAQAEGMIDLATTGVWMTDGRHVIALEVALTEALRAGMSIHATNDDGDGVLHLASRADINPYVVQMLLSAGADVNHRNHRGYTPLHRAAGQWWNSDAEPGILNLLIAAGADVNAWSNEGRSPLHQAAVSGSTALTQALLDAGANPVPVRDDEPFWEHRMEMCSNEDDDEGYALLVEVQAMITEAANRAELLVMVPQDLVLERRARGRL